MEKKSKRVRETQKQRLYREAGEIVNGCFLAVVLLVGLVCSIVWLLKHLG